MDSDLHVVSKAPCPFATEPKVYAAQPVPSIFEYSQLWAAWDLVTRSMIPSAEMLSKPIHLRNACIFYLGHIPAFLDMHLVRATGKAPTEPVAFHNLFERGVDPDVDDPDKVHAHSAIPDEWPPLSDILKYQDHVRARARSLYASTDIHEDHRLGRALWLGFEHEGDNHALCETEANPRLSNASGDAFVYASAE